MAVKLKINRAPVLTLWGAVVAERLGYSPETALTLGRTVAGLNAQSKGQRLGIFEPQEAPSGKEDQTEKEKRTTKTEPKTVRLLGRQVPVLETGEGLRAEEKGKAMNPAAVERYLQQKFKADLPEVRRAMKNLAESFGPEELEKRAFDLYEEFRPAVPEGKRGWGATGELDLMKIEKLAKQP
jgi:hypothetical protein